MGSWNSEKLQQNIWFINLCVQVQAQLDHLDSHRIDHRPALVKEQERWRRKIQGLSQSLANPQLDPRVRAKLESDLLEALEKNEGIQQELSEQDRLIAQTRQIVDPGQVADQLNRLADVLAGQNPSRTNIELSLHIEGIRCYDDGRVAVRTCKLGALAGAMQVIRASGTTHTMDLPSTSAVAAGRPRRRAIRRYHDGNAATEEAKASAHFAADVGRFAGLGEEWFWEDEFRNPGPTFWSKENAEEVGRMRAKNMTHEKLAKFFRVTLPTIRHALEIWRTNNPDAESMPRKMPRRRWEEDHAQEVLHLRKKNGYTMEQLREHFGKSEPTIKKAILFAENQNSLAKASEPPSATSGDIEDT